MRTSNKILLGIFVAPLIIIAAFQFTIYAKYKTGNYVAMKKVQEDRYMRYAPKNIKHIAVYGLGNFTINPADSLKLEIEKDEHGHLHYAVAGDSLVIHGDSTVNRSNGTSDIERSYQQVNLFLPASETIKADNSDINLKGSKDSSNAKSYHFYLSKDASLKVEQEGDDSTHVYFKELAVETSNAAGVELTPHTYIFNLNLSLTKSAFTDNGAFINKLMIDADKESNISLKGDNLKKVNLK